MSNLTVNQHLVHTGERVATIRLTVHLTAEDIAHALADANGDLYLPDEFEGPTNVTADAVRDAAMRCFSSGLEVLSYRAGDNNADDVVEAYTEAVVEQLFDGRQHNEVARRAAQ